MVETPCAPNRKKLITGKKLRFFKNVALLVEEVFLITFFDLYLIHQCYTLQFTIHDGPLWAAINQQYIRTMTIAFIGRLGKGS